MKRVPTGNPQNSMGTPRPNQNMAYNNFSQPASQNYQPRGNNNYDQTNRRGNYNGNFRGQGRGGGGNYFYPNGP